MSFRPFLLVLALLLSLSPLPAPAQGDGAVEELERLVQTLENEAERNKLVGQLKQLIAAHKGIEPENDIIVDDVLIKVVSDRMVEAGQSLALFASQFRDLTRLGDWLIAQFATEDGKAFWLTALIEVILVVGVGVIAGKAADWSVARLQHRLRERRPTTWLRRVLPLVAVFLLDLVPIAAFAAGAYAAFVITAPSNQIGVLLFAVVNAGWIAATLGAVGRLILAPLAPGLRLVPIRDETAAYLYVWLRRLVGIGVYGAFILEGALAVGLPKPAHAAALKALGLLFTVFFIVLTLQNRVSVAITIRGLRAERRAGGKALQVLRERLAEIWHLLAVLYIVALFVVWAVNIEGGFLFVFGGSLATAAIAIGVWVGRGLIIKGVNRLFRINPDLQARFPLLEQRANRYVPVVRGALVAAIYVAATVGFLLAWRIDAIAWFSTGAGRVLMGKIIAIAAIVGVALAVWEAYEIATARYLQRLESPGNKVKLARTRTILPMVRYTVQIMVMVFAGLAVLSEIGVNIGPLLAGAGAIGLAVGLGAQTLVKDIIAGFSILLENTVSVGDTVELAGKIGVVEGLTIKTIRLRDGEGAVHTIPLSALTQVTNRTRDFAYATFELTLPFGQAPERVAQVFEAIDTEIRRDPTHAAHLLGPVEYQGIDRFADAGVVIKARLKTVPGKQWEIKRHYNQRLLDGLNAAGVLLVGQAAAHPEPAKA